MRRVHEGLGREVGVFGVQGGGEGVGASDAGGADGVGGWGGVLLAGGVHESGEIVNGCG